MNIIGEIGSAVSQIITMVGGWVLAVLESSVAIFYTESGLTVIGTLALIGLGMSLVMFGLKYVGHLFKR